MKYTVQTIATFPQSFILLSPMASWKKYVQLYKIVGPLAP